MLKVMKTGSFSGGGDFYRNVNLCPECAEEIERKEAAAKKMRIMVVLVGVLAALGGGAYVLFLYK